MIHDRASHASPRPDEIWAAAEAALVRSRHRVQRIEVAGRAYWVKCEERLSLRMRLQKGSARRAFVAERDALRTLAAEGLPVPPLSAEGPDFFVTPDVGPSLTHLVRDADLVAADRVPAFAAAGAALAAFHVRGFSHGRPSIKDICWDGQSACFVDLERYAPRRNRRAGQVEDLVILVFSAFAEIGGDCPEIRALSQGYQTADRAGIWAGAERYCRRLRWLEPLTRPIQRLKGAREFRAFPLTLSAFDAA